MEVFLQKTKEKAKLLIAKREKNVEPMIKIYDGMKKSSKNRIRYSDKWMKFVESVQAVASSQNEEVGEYFSKFAEIGTQIANLNLDLGTQERRNAEDFRDVFERYEALMEKTKRYTKCKSDYKKASKDYVESMNKDAQEQQKPNYSTKRFKIQENIEKCKDRKIRKLQKVKDALADLIDARKRYNDFKVRRFSEGFTRYGTSLKHAIEDEIELLEQLKASIVDLKFYGKTSEESLSRIEHSLEETLDSKSSNDDQGSNEVNEEPTGDSNFD